jgi:ketosteroid isomerase-like protein
MRPILFAALTMTTLSLAGCGGEEPAPAPPPPPPPPPPAETATASAAPADTTPPPPPKPSLAELMPQTLKGIGDAFNAHDAQKMASYFTDDVAVYSYGEGEQHGRADAQKALTDMFGTFGDAKSAATRVWMTGNVAIAEMAWAGTMTGDMKDMKATKKPVGQMRLHVMWFNDDGLVKELHEYADDAALMAQMKGQKGAPAVPTLPTNAPEVHVAKGTPEEGKLVDWAKGIDEAFNKDDIKAIGADLADDADCWMNFTGMPAIKGKKALTKELTSFLKAFPDQKWTTSNAWGIDGFAIVEHSMSGTFKGPFGPVRPTHKPVSAWHAVDILQPTADGKIQHGWSYMNVVEMMQESGAMKPGGEKAAPAAGKGAGTGAAAAKSPKKK